MARLEPTRRSSTSPTALLPLSGEVRAICLSTAGLAPCLAVLDVLEVLEAPEVFVALGVVAGVLVLAWVLDAVLEPPPPVIRITATTTTTTSAASSSAPPRLELGREGEKGMSPAATCGAGGGAPR